ncbi:MAG: efflux RND transporter periplasmic adaptor subunit [Proteobacteria bacterium]|nr:efflux RND transporter periplasmic adaptor subunit [Pseudomonadota bacterium]
MKRKTILISIGGLVVATGALAMLVGGGDEDLLEVQTAKVSLETIIQTVNATGRIQPKTQIRISADVSAKITTLHVEEGQWVEKGELLVDLDRERYVATVESAQAAVRSAQANAKLVLQNMLKAEKDYDRSRDMVARKLESQAVMDTVDAAYQVEVARYESALDMIEQARATLKQADDSLSKTTIYAPMAGTISDLNKEQGEIAIGSQFQEDVIMIVADLSEMEAQVNVDENDIVSVQIGQIAEIKVDALFGETLRGVVYEIANSANTDAQGTQNQKTEFEVKIAIEGEISRLRPGMTASANVSTQTKVDVVGIPIQSVAVRTIDQLTLEGEEIEAAEKRFTADDDGFVEIVFSVENDGSVLARQVKTGIQSDDMIEILSGISADEEVVIGSYRAISTDLQNGAQVEVNNDKNGGSDDA